MTVSTHGSPPIAARLAEPRFAMHPAVFPVVAGLVAGIGSHLLCLYPAPAAGPDTLAFGGAVLSVAGTMLGFMLAALAVVASINHTHLVSMMKSTGHYRDLLLTLFTGGLMFLACMIVGYVVLFAGVLPPRVASAMVGLHIAALVSLLDIGRKFWMVLANLRPDA